MIDFKLSNGVEIPAMGYGVFQMSSAEVAEHLPQAIQAGFRHIDTANGYYNEVAVGEAVRERCCIFGLFKNTTLIVLI